MAISSESIQRLSWKDIRADVSAINKNLFDIIEEINPSEHYSLYKVRYPFGAKIVDKGKLSLPNQESNFDTISRELNYAAVPLALIINKSCEVFIENKQQIIPLNLLSSAQLFGLFEVLAKQTNTESKQPPWSITAGARSIFMLPKITDMNAHRRVMREYKLQSQPPQSLDEHWQIFTKIAQHADIKNPWCCEILFFSDAWLFKQQDNILWSKFNRYLYSQAWIESAYLRNKTLLNLLWEILASSLISQNLKLKPYLMQIIKQLTAISYGFASGYQPAGRNEMVAPIAAIEDAYVKVYDLKEYLPIIMHASNLSGQTQQSTYYYSLSAETLHEGSFTSAQPPRVISRVRQTKQLMEAINAHVATNPLLQTYQQDEINYHYFHITEEKDTNIKSTKDLPAFDPCMIETFHTYKDRIFPAASPFIRGSISITVSKTLKEKTSDFLDDKDEAQKVLDLV